MQVPRALLNPFMPQKMQWLLQLFPSFRDLRWVSHAKPTWVSDSAELRSLAAYRDELDPSVSQNGAFFSSTWSLEAWEGDFCGDILFMM